MKEKGETEGKCGETYGLHLVYSPYSTVLQSSEFIAREIISEEQVSIK
jgi:hypothetical protein